jgi:predicted XRE-type DNA-binding protein
VELWIAAADCDASISNKLRTRQAIGMMISAKETQPCKKQLRIGE